MAGGNWLPGSRHDWVVQSLQAGRLGHQTGRMWLRCRRLSDVAVLRSAKCGKSLAFYWCAPACTQGLLPCVNGSGCVSKDVHHHIALASKMWPASAVTVNDGGHLTRDAACCCNTTSSVSGHRIAPGDVVLVAYLFVMAVFADGPTCLHQHPLASLRAACALPGKPRVPTAQRPHDKGRCCLFGDIRSSDWP